MGDVPTLERAPESGSKTVRDELCGHSMGTALVSIVIPALNSARTLARCLESIGRQVHHDIEVIVVDANSTDETVAVARRYGARVILSRDANMAIQTNLGIEGSSGRFVYRVDSDIELSRESVEACVLLCETGDVDAVCVFWAPDSSLGFWARVRAFEAEFYRKDLFPRGARFFTREAIEVIGGFDAELEAGEDYDIFNRLAEANLKIGRVHTTDLHLGEPRSLGEIVRKNYHYGKSARSFLAQHPELGVSQMMPPLVLFARVGGHALRNPGIAAGYLVYVTAKYISASLGLVASLLPW